MAISIMFCIACVAARFLGWFSFLVRIYNQHSLLGLEGERKTKNYLEKDNRERAKQSKVEELGSSQSSCTRQKRKCWSNSMVALCAYWRDETWWEKEEAGPAFNPLIFLKHLFRPIRYAFCSACWQLEFQKISWGWMQVVFPTPSSLRLPHPPPIVFWCDHCSAFAWLYLILDKPQRKKHTKSTINKLKTPAVYTDDVLYKQLLIISWQKSVQW